MENIVIVLMLANNFNKNKKTAFKLNEVQVKGTWLRAASAYRPHSKLLNSLMAKDCYCTNILHLHWNQQIIPLFL
jgi:hypothetical protein